jgi:tetratricopeptide (TPR) repeat protein
MMKLTPLACAFVAASILVGCAATPSKNNSNNNATVFAEPEISAPFYALNPINYEQPSAFELALIAAEKQPVTKMVVSRQDDPSRKLTLDTNKLIIPTVNNNQRSMTYAALAAQGQVDVTDIDDFLNMVEGKARHYPPRFTERKERRGFETKLKQVSAQLDTLAAAPDASFDVLVRAFKAAVMGRNLDLGSSYTTKSLNYAQRILKINPNDAEVNFWFGFALSEGGGHKEAIPYLDKAIQAGVQEAYLSATNNYIAMEQKKNAVQTLKNYKVKYPQESAVADRLIQEIEKQGRWNVWQVMNK